MSHSKGYALEHEVETLLMGLEDQKRCDPLHTRTRRQPASGAMASAKGDVVTNLSFLDSMGQIMVECKDRKNARGDGKSVSIKKEELDKLRVEAESEMKLPVFAFKVKQPQGGDRRPLFPGDRVNPMNTKWFAMPFGTFIYMLEYIRDLQREVDTLRVSPRGPEVPAPSSVSGECRACRKALDKAVAQVLRTMGG